MTNHEVRTLRELADRFLELAAEQTRSATLDARQRSREYGDGRASAFREAAGYVYRVATMLENAAAPAADSPPPHVDSTGRAWFGPQPSAEQASANGCAHCGQPMKYHGPAGHILYGCPEPADHDDRETVRDDVRAWIARHKVRDDALDA